MDILIFILEIIRALCWPVTVLILVTLLRKPLGILLTTLKNLKFKELEISFSQEIRELEDKIPEDIKDLPPEKRATEETQSESERLNRLLKDSPRSAIIDAWRIVELAAGQAFHKQNPIPKIPNWNIKEILVSLETDGFVTEATGNYFRALNQLRNQAIYNTDFKISEHDARSYLHNAISLATYLKMISSERHMDGEK